MVSTAEFIIQDLEYTEIISHFKAHIVIDQVKVVFFEMALFIISLCCMVIKSALVQRKVIRQPSIICGSPRLIIIDQTCSRVEEHVESCLIPIGTQVIAS